MRVGRVKIARDFLVAILCRFVATLVALGRQLENDADRFTSATISDLLRSSRRAVPVPLEVQPHPLALVVFCAGSHPRTRRLQSSAESATENAKSNAPEPNMNAKPEKDRPEDKS